MEIVFIGVGEAFDQNLPNCSALVLAEGGQGAKSILLDCGFTVPFALWRTMLKEPDLPGPLTLDAVWISHFHGDHFFGLPALLLRFYEEGRTETLHLLGQEGMEKTVLAAMDLAYPGTRAKFAFSLEFHEISPGAPLSLLGLSLSAAHSEHPRPNLSLRLEDANASIFYSGDGRPTDATLELARDAHLIIHESFSLEPDTAGHGTVPGSIEFARRAGVPELALVHIRRDVRAEHMQDIRQAMDQAQGLIVHLPEPGDRLRV
ncbi:MAG: ribonuclease Z [Desulfovibrio sp.]|nr:MAG: ribonuclease Z [Desulfovibrio sp.]